VCIFWAHGRIQHVKLRLFVHTQVAFVDFLKVSSNFHTVKTKSGSPKELKSNYRREQRF